MHVVALCDPTWREHGPLHHLGDEVDPDQLMVNKEVPLHPGGNPGANLQSISHRCYLRKVAFESELTKETIDLPLGCLQGGL